MVTLPQRSQTDKETEYQTCWKLYNSLSSSTIITLFGRQIESEPETVVVTDAGFGNSGRCLEKTVWVKTSPFTFALCFCFLLQNNCQRREHGNNFDLRSHSNKLQVVINQNYPLITKAWQYLLVHVLLRISFKWSLISFGYFFVPAATSFSLSTASQNQRCRKPRQDPSNTARPRRMVQTLIQ